MRFFRGLMIGLASLLCVFAITTCIWLMTLQATLLNPHITKGWLRSSGVYGKVIDSFVQTPASQDNTVLTAAATKQALKNTFTASYVQEQTEHTLDSVYAWIEGKAPTISFSIPIDDKKTTLLQQLSASIEPSIQQLPICSATSQTAPNQVTCRPADKSVIDFTNEVASQAVNSSGALTTPITQQTIAPQAQSNSPQGHSNTDLLSQLPTYYAWIGRLVIILPIVVLLCLILIFLVASDRLLAFARISRRIFFSTLVNVLAAIAFLYLGAHLTTIPGLTANGQNADLLATLLPIAQRMLSSIGGELTLLSGGVAGISLIAWIVLQTLHHKRQLAHIPNEPPVSPPETPEQQTTMPPVSIA